MRKKNIVSIEDRIPKLKEMRKRKTNQRLILYLSTFFLLISIIVYLQSPLSNIKNIKVVGNSFITKEEIIKQSTLTKKTNIWTINQKRIKQGIGEISGIKSVEVSRKLPWTVEISLKEFQRVGYLKDENESYPILENGETLGAIKNPIGDAPLIIGFTEKAYLNRMTKELKLLPKSILNLISEIHWTPTDENNYKILLYMNDGFIVDGTIRNFGEKMKVYPSIISQLKPDSKGILHIGVGAYFEDFNKEIEVEE